MRGHQRRSRRESLVGAPPVGLVQVKPDHLRAGSTWTSTVAVSGFPPEVGMAWLEPLTAWPGVLDVAVHVDPIPAQSAAARVRRRRIRMESTRRLRADRGGLEDPLMEAVSQDAGDLADKVARGESRLFFATVLITVHALSRRQLEADVAGLRAHAASMLLETHVMTWRQLQGWMSALPIGVDLSRMRRVMDTEALAAACPIAGPDLPEPLPGDVELTQGESTGGRRPSSPVLMGLNLMSGAIVTGDRWSLDNHNQIVLARSGAGKSYAVKTGILREMYNGVKVSVIDPEREYLELARQVGGQVVELGTAGAQINPMQLPSGDPDAFSRRCLFLHTLVDVMLEQPLDPSQRAVLDQAIIAAYFRAGITRDAGTWTSAAPTFVDLLRELEARAENEQGPNAANVLTDRISPWVTGSFSGLFSAHAGGAQQRGPAAAQQLTVWTTRLLAEELRPVGMLLAIDTIWRSLDRPTTTAGQPAGHRPIDRNGGEQGRRLVVVDEASLLLVEPAGARFLARLAKTSRKRRAGLTLITPDVVDVLGSDLGETILANAATVLLLHQAPQAIQTLTRACALSPGEAQFLTTARRGQGLLLAGARVPLDIVASPAEHAIASAPPDDLDDLDDLDDQHDQHDLPNQHDQPDLGVSYDEDDLDTFGQQWPEPQEQP